MNETRILRSRLGTSIDGLDRLVSPPPTGTQKFLGTVVAPGSGVSLLADHYVSVYGTSIDGAETEGGAVSFVQDTSQKILGIVLGLAPVAGDRLVFTSYDGRWVARKRGGGTGPIIPTPGYALCCPSDPIPPSLTMTVVFSPGTNAGTYFNTYQSTTLTYFTTAPSYATGVFASNDRFYSPILTDSLGETFYYMLNCALSQFALIQQFTPPFFGSATAVTWNITSCNPFLLSAIFLRSSGYLGGFGATGSTDNIIVS